MLDPSHRGLKRTLSKLFSVVLAVLRENTGTIVGETKFGNSMLTVSVMILKVKK